MTGHTGSARLGTWDLALLLGFLAVYVWCYVMFCLLQVAPLPWDEAFLHDLPAAIVAALSDHGLLAAWDTLAHTHYHKPPLSGLGTLPAMLLFGDGPLSVRLDNLALVVLAAWLLLGFFRQHMHPSLAVAFTVAIVVSPYAMKFSRDELAELYVWVATLIYLLALHRCGTFGDRRQSVYLGVGLGLGMLSKASFPIVVIGPTLWVIARAFVRRCYRDSLGMRARNGLIALGTGLLIALPSYASNYKYIWRHAMSQYGPDSVYYSLGDPHTWQVFTGYVDQWQTWFGGIWVLLLVVAVLVTPFLVRRSSWLRELPLGMLGAGIFVNLVYCYHHPVTDMRFTFGSFLMTQLLVALVVGVSVSHLPRGQATLGRLLLVPLLLLLLSNSFWADSRERVLFEGCDVALIGPVPPVVYLEAPAPDLREDVIGRLPLRAGGRCDFSLAGDHRYLNNNNLLLTIRKRGVPGGVLQLGYLDRSLDSEGRIRHSTPGYSLAFVAVHNPTESGAVSPFHRHAKGLHDLLEANPHIFRPLPWVGDLQDGYHVVIYERLGKTDDSLIVPAKDKVPAFQLTVPSETGTPPPPIVWGDRNAVHWRQTPPPPTGLMGVALLMRGDPGANTDESLKEALQKDRLYGVTFDATISDITETTPDAGLRLETPAFALSLPPLRGRHVRTMVIHTGGHVVDKLCIRLVDMGARVRVRQVALEPLVAIHRDFGLCILGEGEEIRDGEYVFRAAILRGAPARVLHSHTAHLAPQQWFLALGQSLVLRIDTGQLTMEGASLSASIEGLRIEASVDQATWQPLAQVPAARQLYVRLTNTSDKPVQVPLDNLSFRAAVDAPAGFRAVGSTTYRLATP